MMDGHLIWITGLAGSGKSSIAQGVRAYCNEAGIDSISLDGDAFRQVMGHDLGYGAMDRRANAYRIARMSHLLVAQGFNVICSTISLYHEIHALNRGTVANYFEILVQCPVEELQRRDQKKLYSQAAEGIVKLLSGVTQPCEWPENPDLILHNEKPDALNANIRLAYHHIQSFLRQEQPSI